MVFNTERRCSKAKVGGVFTYHGCRSAFHKLKFVLECFTYHVVPDDQVCWGAGGYSKIIGKAGNDGSVNDIQCLASEAKEALRASSLFLRLPVMRWIWCFQLRSMESSTPRYKRLN